MRVLAATLALLALAAAPAAAQDPAPGAGAGFEPDPLSQPAFGTAPETHKITLKGVDGTDLFVETWLPAARDGGPEPPARLPVVLISTPYVSEGQQRYTTRNLHNIVEWFTQRGYAVAQHHVRGTGSSGGCLEQSATLQIDDHARVIEWLGERSPWAAGAVGMYGHSYDAETQLSVAGRGDPDRIGSLKAIVPSASVGGQYEYSFMDGVPYAGQAALSNGGYFVGTVPADVPQHNLRRAECMVDIAPASLDYSGDMGPFWREREYRPGAPNIKAATLFVHGLQDWNVQPITIAGFFDRLPATTPKAGLFGQWEHNMPDKHNVNSAWAREDWLPMVTAWYDRWLKGLPTGADRWPRVQVQGTDGQWRHEAGFPQTGGPAGQLALGPAGALGATEPTGSTSFLEGPDSQAATRAVFQTPEFEAPLHLTGMPVADLWLTTSLPDAHLVAKLQLVDETGAVIRQPGETKGIGSHGARSLMHLEPMPSGFFEQSRGRPAPTGTPIRVPLRLQPLDIVAPAGSRLRLTIAGSTTWARATTPGAASQITLLHDCERPSALRFLTARPDGPLLDVREVGEEGALGTSDPDPAPRTVDGGGLASAPVCGRAPERPAAFGDPVSRPERALAARPGRRAGAGRAGAAR
jgi:X-Pro dipeptidyl-peptidase